MVKGRDMNDERVELDADALFGPSPQSRDCIQTKPRSSYFVSHVQQPSHTIDYTTPGRRQTSLITIYTQQNTPFRSVCSYHPA